MAGERMHKEIDSLQAFLRNGISFDLVTVQGIDFSSLTINWQSLKIDRTTFLGCRFKPEDKLYLINQGAIVLERPEHLPYDPFRNKLYTWQELLHGTPSTRDLTIYEHFHRSRYNPPINEALWQRIHDHAIDDALRELIVMNDDGMPTAKCVGIMGGHRTSRLDPSYRKVALTAKWLTEAGYLVASGGGPGIMEAANLGAFFAGKSDNSLTDAIQHMSEAPVFINQQFTQLAIDITRTYPSHGKSLAIPTWFYGHEPSNVFSSAIAKYFSNSIREDTLLAICIHGVIYAPGSAGTVQEIFMDAAQNHYGTYNFYSPMIFLGKEHFEYETTIYPLLRRLAPRQVYSDLLHLTDEPEEIVTFIRNHPPIPVNSH